MSSTRPIELARLFDDQTWDTIMVYIPAGTPENMIEEIAAEKAVEEFGGSVSMFSIYNTYEDYEEE